jgi:hypothetical protein
LMLFYLNLHNPSDHFSKGAALPLNFSLRQGSRVFLLAGRTHPTEQIANALCHQHHLVPACVLGSPLPGRAQLRRRHR